VPLVSLLVASWPHAIADALSVLQALSHVMVGQPSDGIQPIRKQPKAQSLPSSTTVQRGSAKQQEHLEHQEKEPMKADGKNISKIQIKSHAKSHSLLVK